MMNKIQFRFKILSTRFIGPLIIAVGYPHYSSFKSDRWGGVIVKPLDGQSGKGITKLSIKNYVDINELLNELKNSYNICLLEEIIKQDESMSALNASSVNSVRLPTFLNKDGFHVLKPFIRIGREGSVVDNTGAGGIFACINEKTGILATEGMCETDGCLYKVHPDSKHQILGWQIPHWNDLLSLAEKIHRTIPSYPYVGWDFALTKTGWVLIEGNWGQFTTEYLDKEGVKEKFDAMFD